MSILMHHSTFRVLTGNLHAIYEHKPIIAEDMEAAKQEVEKLSPGAMIVSKTITDMRKLHAIFYLFLVNTHHLLDKKHTILSNTVNLLDKIDYLFNLIQFEMNSLLC